LIVPLDTTDTTATPSSLAPEQEMMGWHWYQSDHMQIICTSLQQMSDNHTSTSPLSFSQARRPSCRPTKALKAVSVQVQCNKLHTKMENFLFLCSNEKTFVVFAVFE